MNGTDLDLLARYARHKAEDAFTELVQRHLNLVYSAALRQVRSPQLAEEIAQSTFVKLAENAHQLAPDTILTAWLYKVTHREAINVGLREARRKLREQIATEINAMNATADDWLQIEPILDEAMLALEDIDRAAILLRFFENKSLSEVGQALGSSENAAQKRVTRAIERLREFLARRGVVPGTSGLVVAISANAVQAAPMGLVTSISSAAILAGVAGFTGTAASVAEVAKVAPTGFKYAWSQLVSTTKVKIALSAIGVASLVVPLALQHRVNEVLRIENASMHNQLGAWGELQSLQEENRRLGQLQVDPEALPQARDNHSALLRLRGEVGRLRTQIAGASQTTPTWSLQTNTAISSWLVGQEIPKENWRDAGFASPENTLETYWWALANGQVERLGQCLALGTNESSITSEWGAETVKEQGYILGIGRCRGMVLMSIGFSNEKSVVMELALMKDIVISVGGKQLEKDDPRRWGPDRRKAKMCKNGNEWKVLPHYTLAALKFLNILRYHGPIEAAQIWPELPPEVAEELRTKLDKKVIADRFPWMLDTNARPK